MIPHNISELSYFSGSVLNERSSLDFTHIGENYVRVYFYQFEITTPGPYPYEFELQYRNTSSDIWIVEDSFTPYATTSVRSRTFIIRGLKSRTEYAFRVVLKKLNQITWQTSTLIIQTKPFGML